MNLSTSAGELATVQGQEFYERQYCTNAAGRSGVTQMISCISWSLLGTSLFFLLHALLAGDQSPAGTFCSAFFAGAVGVFVSALSLRKCAGFKQFLAVIVTAYLLRVLVGMFLCLQVMNPNYFDGDGRYLNKNWEFRWTYENIMTASDSVLKKGEWRTKKIFPTNEDKNAYIHTWIGYFMAAGQSRHCLDLAPFNAFHHIIAGIFVVGLALACGYQQRVAMFSGALIAWIPWAFASSIMWRDSVGFAWVVLAMVFLCIGREFGLLGSLLSAIPAAFLAWADRSPYLIVVVVVTFLSIVYDQQKFLKSSITKISRFLIVATILVCGVYLLQRNIALVAMERHENHLNGLSFRLLTSPLLVLRALAGPFPWFFGGNYSSYLLCDYLYHVFQFAMFLIIVKKWKVIVARLNILTYSAVFFWVSAFIAGGVHTAYLAVAAPFMLPPVLDTGANIWKYLVISAVCFIVANVVYVSAGFTGSGLVLGVTGY